MIWQSTAMQKAAVLDQPMIDELSIYLQNKEAFLGAQLIGSIHTPAYAPS